MTASDPSPLNLLLRRSDRDDPSLTDALILTFNHDLAFFEREVLGLLGLTGCVTTVVGDARVTGHDLYAVHRAGISYLPGLASCAGAFHPKLIALVGADEATVAVGSGNLTLSGWRANDELWSVHRAHRHGGSIVPAQVGEFLMELPDVVHVVRAVADALRRVGAALVAMAGEYAGHTLVSSLSRPIIDQLPIGPVDELLLYAPFHDETGSAVRRLIERFEPSAVRVAYQPESTVMDGGVLAALIADRGCLVPLSNAPYRHGKLIEWSIGAARWTLTGSANLSAAALLRTARNGGNVELGVVSVVEQSLMPPEKDDPGADHRLPVYIRKEQTSAGRDVLLAAIGNADGVALMFARPLSRSGTIEYSAPTDPPERWHVGPALTAGSTEYQVSLPIPGGARIRTAFDDGSATTAVFVADLASIHRDRSTRRLGPRVPDLGEVLTDPEAAELFWSILRSDANRVRAPRPTRRAAGAKAVPDERSATAGDWRSYLDRCRTTLGPQMLAFALGLLDLEQGAGDGEHRLRDWDADGPILDEPGALEDDEADTDVPDHGPASLEVLKLHLTDAMRAKYRAFAQRRANQTADSEPHETLLALRQLLLLAAGGAWNTSDLSWTDLVLRTTMALTSCEGPELEEAAGSLAAVALAVVGHAYMLHPSKGLDRSAYRSAADAVGHLLVAVDEERVAEYVKGLRRFSSGVEPCEVLRLRDLLVNDDPIELVLKELEDQGIECTRRGSLVVLVSSSPNPLLFARRAYALRGACDNVALRAPGAVAAGWAAIVHASPDHLELRSGTRPNSVLVTHTRLVGGRSHTLADTTATQPVPDESLAVLQRLGLDIEDLRTG